MKFKQLSFLFLLILFSCQKSESAKKAVATVGSRSITIAELKDRANFNPTPGNHSIEQHKQNVLNSIIAEVLLSQLDNPSLPEHISLLTTQRKREAVIEKLWQDIVFKDIQIDDAALWPFYLNTKRQREIEFSVFTDSIKADNFYKEWKKDNPLVNNVLSKDSISFSGNIAILEKEVFHAKLDTIARPIKVGRKYIVFKPLNEWQTNAASQQEFNEKYKSIKKSYIKIVKHEYLIEYSKKTFKKENYQMNRSLFKQLTMALENQVLNKPELKEINTNFLEFSATANNLDPAAVIVHFDKGENLTIRDFIKQLAVSPYPLNYTSKGAFRYSLIKAAKRILDDELLYRKGLQHKLDQSDYVTWQTAMWRDFYVSRSIMAKKHFSADKLYQVLDSLKNNTEIDIQWQVFDTLTVNKSDMIVLKTHFPEQTIVPKLSFFNFQVERE